MEPAEEALRPGPEPDWLGSVAAPAWLTGGTLQTVAPRTQLLILQPTPYCNIDCSYCYLPDRGTRASMSKGTVRAAIGAVQADGLNQGGLTVVWHAGEPFVLPADYYRDVFEVIRQETGSADPVRLAIQTNATAVTPEHCRVLQDYAVSVGVSLDGPAFLHDAYRRTRNGKGTHRLTLRGLELLQRAGLDPGVIAVVTDRSLAHGRDLVTYVRSLGVTKLSLNFEEIDGGNASSSLQNQSLSRVDRFLRDVYRASREAGVRVREFDDLAVLVSRGRPPDQQVAAFSIVTVDWRGNFSTFSPELLDHRDTRYGSFHFGNVHSGGILDAVHNPRFESVSREIQAGVKRCRDECALFNLCGGGAPSNKLAERGTFNATETLSCRIRTKTVARVFIQEVGRESA